jgi:hypothetical protein
MEVINKGILNALAEIGLDDKARGAKNFIQGLLSPTPTGLVPIAQDSNFIRELEKYATSSNTPIENLMAVMSLETKNTFNPSIKAGNSSATGLVQFLEATAKELGTTTQDMRKMSRVEQLPFATKVFNRGRGDTKTPRSLVNTYLSVFAPAHINKSMDYQIYKRGGKRYTANPSLDPDNKGYISKRTIEKALQPYLKNANKILNERSDINNGR